MAAGLALLGLWLMRTTILNALLFYPTHDVDATPSAAGLAFEEVEIATEDGPKLHAWWVPATAPPHRGHVIYCHGNGGNISYRIGKARLLADRGFDVLLFDYRGYGRSEGSPSEAGLYRDARAARAAVVAREGVDPDRLVYLGESLGGAVAIALALDIPPAGLVLQSTFTSVRQIARFHYPIVPTFYVPDAFPSLTRIPRLSVPVLMVHGDADRIVPVEHGRTLYASAPQPKTYREFPGVGHNDLVDRVGDEYVDLMAEWFDGIGTAP